MRTGLPAALLRGTPSAIRDDRFTRCPFPAATTHAPVALARSSNTAMEHRNRCTDPRHPELLATSLLKCPRQVCCETPSETKKIGKLSPLSSFIFLTLRGQGTCPLHIFPLLLADPRSDAIDRHKNLA